MKMDIMEELIALMILHAPLIACSVVNILTTEKPRVLDGVTLASQVFTGMLLFVIVCI